MKQFFIKTFWIKEILGKKKYISKKTRCDRKSKQTGYWTLTILRKKYLCAIKLVKKRKKIPSKNFQLISIFFDFFFFLAFLLNRPYWHFHTIFFGLILFKKVFWYKGWPLSNNNSIAILTTQLCAVIWNKNRQQIFFLEREQYKV